MHGKKCAAFQHGWCRPCWTARSLEENWQVPKFFLLNWADSAKLRRGLTTSKENIGTVRIWCPAKNAPLRMRLQSTKSREVRTLISTGGWLRRGRADSVEGVGAQSGKGAHSTKDGNPWVGDAYGRSARGRGRSERYAHDSIGRRCLFPVTVKRVYLN